MSIRFIDSPRPLRGVLYPGETILLVRAITNADGTVTERAYVASTAEEASGIAKRCAEVDLNLLEQELAKDDDLNAAIDRAMSAAK